MTNNLNRRLHEHNSGKVSSTKSRRPFVLIYQEHCINRTLARGREIYFKSAAGRRFLDKVEAQISSDRCSLRGLHAGIQIYTK
jgi:putative endonuclease